MTTRGRLAGQLATSIASAVLGVLLGVLGSVSAFNRQLGTLEGTTAQLVQQVGELRADVKEALTVTTRERSR